MSSMLFSSWDVGLFSCRFGSARACLDRCRCRGRRRAGVRRRPSRICSGSVSRSSLMSRKFDSSPARREVSWYAAPKATVHAVPTWPSIWLPITTSRPRPSARWCTRCEPVKPVRAVLMLIAVADPPSTSRVTSAGVGYRFVGDERDVELLDQPAPAHHVVGRAQAPRRRAGPGRPSPSWRAATPTPSSRGCRRRTARPRRRTARAARAPRPCPAGPGAGRP